MSELNAYVMLYTMWNTAVAFLGTEQGKMF